MVANGLEPDDAQTCAVFHDYAGGAAAVVFRVVGLILHIIVDLPALKRQSFKFLALQHNCFIFIIIRHETFIKIYWFWAIFKIGMPVLFIILLLDIFLRIQHVLSCILHIHYNGIIISIILYFKTLLIFNNMPCWNYYYPILSNYTFK